MAGTNRVDKAGNPGKVELVSHAQLPTRYGEFQIAVFRETLSGEEHVAVFRGQIRQREHVPFRLHSECLTGDVLGSLRCDCREQLERSLMLLGRVPYGLLLYMRQEGRGIGLGNKIKAYALQEHGLDTVEANEYLGFKNDLRRYDVAAEILKEMGVLSVEIYTNNPEKIRGLEASGIKISRRLPLHVTPQAYNSSYLDTKRAKCGHLL